MVTSFSIGPETQPVVKAILLLGAFSLRACTRVCSCLTRLRIFVALMRREMGRVTGDRLICTCLAATDIAKISVAMKVGPLSMFVRRVVVGDIVHTIHNLISRKFQATENGWAKYRNSRVGKRNQLLV